MILDDYGEEVQIIEELSDDNGNGGNGGVSGGVSGERGQDGSRSQVRDVSGE